MTHPEVSEKGSPQIQGDKLDDGGPGVGANALTGTALPGEAQAPTGLGPDGRVSAFAEISALFDCVRGIVPVGSRVTCNPPPTDTDEDWLVYAYKVDGERLRAAGFTQDGSPQFYTGNDNGGFRSWRRGDLNIVTTESNEFYWRFVTATDLAKRFNLLAKADRIALFQAVLYGVRVDNLEPAPVGRHPQGGDLEQGSVSEANSTRSSEAGGAQ